jgi:hypothetical protein
MKRPWFQIHLSTAIVMMFVAGGMLFVNIRIQREFTVVERSSSKTTVNFYDGWGWPLLYDSRGSFAFSSGSGSAVETNLLSQVLEFHDECPRVFSIAAAIIDGLVGLVSMALIVFFSEAMIRRREARKP